MFHSTDSRSQGDSSPSASGSAIAAAVEVSGHLVRTARLAEEWYCDLNDPATLIDELRRTPTADVFTFWQRLPDVSPRYPYHCEWDTIAVLPVTTYEHWWKSQINNKTRNLVVKARKKGVVVRKAEFDDEFVRGVTAIFNETPIRQERPFAHFGKDFATVKREFSRFLFRETVLGAYVGDQLIGFVMLADAGPYASLTQIISMVRHRDKSPNNALLAAAVELCAERQVPRLVYALWPRGPLRDFKKHNGFEPVALPRYYVPLTAKGAVALKLKLHKSLGDRLPEPTVDLLKEMRSKFYAFRYRPRGDKEASHTTSPSVPTAERSSK